MTIPKTSFIPKFSQPEKASGLAYSKKAAGDGEPLIQRVSPTIHPDTLSYEDAYERNVWLYRAILAIATNVGQVPIKIQRSKDNGQTFEDETSDTAHKIISLIQRPNSETRGSELLEQIAICKNLRQALVWMSWGKPIDGPREAPLIGQKAKAAPPLNLYVLPAHRTVAKTVDNKLVAWEIRETQTTIPACQVLRFAHFNPKNRYKGLPPSNPAYQSADTDYALEIHHANFFENGAKLSGLISLDGSVSDEKKQRIQAAIDQVTGVGNSHTFLTLDNNAKFSSFMAEMKDMDFKNLSEKQRDKIAAAVGVGRFIFGDPIDANKATAKEVRKLFWMDIILPLLRDIEDGLTIGLIQPYYDAQLYLKFDISKIDALSESRDDFATAFFQLAQGLALMVGNALTAQEARDILREQFGLNIDETMKVQPKPATPPPDKPANDKPEPEPVKP